MMRPYLFGILVLLAFSCSEVSSRPNNESTTAANVEETTKASKDGRVLTYNPSDPENDEAAKEILEKIKAINDALKKPNRRNQHWNPPYQTGSYVLDKETLEKLQQVIASGKLNSKPDKVQQQDGNTLNDLFDGRYSRQLSPLYAQSQAQMALLSTPYLTSMPVLVMPSMNNMYSSMNTMDYATKIQTKQDGGSPSPFPTFPTFPSLPPVQWPLAPLFPILIRDPLLSIMNGGGWSNFIEYGQSADVCNRKQKSNDQEPSDQENNEITKNIEELEKVEKILANPSRVTKNSRQKRAVKKRTVPHATQFQDLDPEQIKKFFAVKTTTAKPTKQDPAKHDTKTVHKDEGDVKFNLFDMFGHKRPTGPGFVINRLKVRRGGVAIAGPGGVATAGRGGTAIVGPGGLAYTQPGGLAVAGPAARIIALSSDADLSSVAQRLQEQSTRDRSISQLLQAIPEGKIVAIGPVIYYHPNNL